MTTSRIRTAAPALSGRAGPPPQDNGRLEPFELADGTVIAIRDTGPAGASDVVLLVAGWTQDHTSWADVVAELRRQHPGLRVVTFDARGHGWSDAGPRGSNTIDQLGDDVGELVTRYLAGRQVVLAGHSLGGPVIMAFSERHPEVMADQVVGVALVATSAGRLGHDVFGLPAPITAPARILTPLVAILRELSRAHVNLHHPGLIAGFIRMGFYGPGAATARNRERTAAQVGRAHPATSAALVEEMLRHDRLHTLAELDRTPTVVLAGTKDGLCPMAHSRTIAAAMPNAQLIAYPGAGHMLPFERPVEVAAQLGALATADAGQAARRPLADRADNRSSDFVSGGPWPGGSGSSLR